MIVAHASGFSWDEGLLVLAPIVVVTFLLTVARRRVRHQAQRPDQDILRHDVPGNREPGDGELRD